MIFHGINHPKSKLEGGLKFYQKNCWSGSKNFDFRGGVLWARAILLGGQGICRRSKIT